MATRKRPQFPIYTQDFPGESFRVAFIRSEGYVTMMRGETVVAYHETYQDAYRDAAERNALVTAYSLPCPA